MKHLIIILALVLGAYLAWHISTPKARRMAALKAAPHALKLTVIFVVIFLAVMAAAYLPATSLF